ncbi:MAG: ComEC/Rec2 family competence protein [Holosporales bacterium]|nr:ComEC/Rec2 family competence protein [Holosporales bacterium]
MNLNRKIFKDIILEKQNLPLFSPVVLGCGIMRGVFYPFFQFGSLLIFLAVSLAISFLTFKKFKIISVSILLFAVGVYVSQTGGLFETNLLSQKKFVEKEYDSIKFLATVKFVDETHPTMKNMRRITFKNMKFTDNPELSFVKTAKTTCSSRMSDGLLPNDSVEVFGKISPYKLPAIPNSFDQIQYNSLVKLDATGIVYRIEKLSDGGDSSEIFTYLRCFLTKQILKKLDKTAGGIASALLTGDKSPISQDIREKYINSGTAHILAISGLHMSIVASLIFFLFLKIMQYVSLLFHAINPKKYAALITIPITFLYLELSGESPSAVRAFIMTTIFLISVVLGRKVFSLRSVSLAAFLILLFDSGSLFLVSFQLSFSAVVVLISFYETFQRKFATLKNACDSWDKKICFYFISSSVTTLIASVATLPISIATFNRLSLSGLLGNLIAIPTVSFIVMPLGIISLAACYFSDFFINALKYVLIYLTHMMGLVADIPGSAITVRSPGALALYTIMAGGIILALLKTKIRHIGTSLICCGLLFWILEESPDIIVPPNSDVVCFIENGKFYATSLKKDRPRVLSVQRNLGFDGKLEKKEIACFPFAGFQFEKGKYPRGLFVWSKTNKIKQIAKRRHPFCPASFEDFTFDN